SVIVAGRLVPDAALVIVAAARVVDAVGRRAADHVADRAARHAADDRAARVTRDSAAQESAADRAQHRAGHAIVVLLFSAARLGRGEARNSQNRHACNQEQLTHYFLLSMPDPGPEGELGWAKQPPTPQQTHHMRKRCARS